MRLAFITLIGIGAVAASAAAWAGNTTTPAPASPAPTIQPYVANAEKPANNTAVPQLAPARQAPRETGGTPITTEQANTFYQGCIDNPGALPRLNPIQRDYLCSCVAAGMQANLTVEDVNLMNDLKTPAGRSAMGKMLETTYFPCALQPIEEGVRAECVARVKSSTYGTAGAQYCGCLTKKMMDYVRRVGISDTLYNLTMNGQVAEPLDALTNGSGYNSQLIQSYQSCFGSVP